ncbi:MAG: hypothetical protein WC323_00945 [Patescibacteria group bacterium]|jgi:hypothetical protein
MKMVKVLMFVLFMFVPFAGIATADGQWNDGGWEWTAPSNQFYEKLQVQGIVLELVDSKTDAFRIKFLPKAGAKQEAVLFEIWGGRDTHGVENRKVYGTVISTLNTWNEVYLPRTVSVEGVEVEVWWSVGFWYNGIEGDAQILLQYGKIFVQPEIIPESLGSGGSPQTPTPTPPVASTPTPVIFTPTPTTPAVSTPKPTATALPQFLGPIHYVEFDSATLDPSIAGGSNVVLGKQFYMTVGNEQARRVYLRGINAIQNRVQVQVTAELTAGSYGQVILGLLDGANGTMAYDQWFIDNPQQKTVTLRAVMPLHSGTAVPVLQIASSFGTMQVKFSNLIIQEFIGDIIPSSAVTGVAMEGQTKSTMQYSLIPFQTTLEDKTGGGPNIRWYPDVQVLDTPVVFITGIFKPIDDPGTMGGIWIGAAESANLQNVVYYQFLDYARLPRTSNEERGWVRFSARLELPHDDTTPYVRNLRPFVQVAATGKTDVAVLARSLDIVVPGQTLDLDLLGDIITLEDPRPEPIMPPPTNTATATATEKPTSTSTPTPQPTATPTVTSTPTSPLEVIFKVKIADESWSPWSEDLSGFSNKDPGNAPTLVIRWEQISGAEVIAQQVRIKVRETDFQEFSYLGDAFGANTQFVWGGSGNKPEFGRSYEFQILVSTDYASYGPFQNSGPVTIEELNPAAATATPTATSVPPIPTPTFAPLPVWNTTNVSDPTNWYNKLKYTYFTVGEQTGVRVGWFAEYTSIPAYQRVYGNMQLLSSNLGGSAIEKVRMPLISYRYLTVFVRVPAETAPPIIQPILVDEGDNNFVCQPEAFPHLYKCVEQYTKKVATDGTWDYYRITLAFDGVSQGLSIGFVRYLWSGSQVRVEYRIGLTKFSGDYWPISHQVDVVTVEPTSPFNLW